MFFSDLLLKYLKLFEMGDYVMKQDFNIIIITTSMDMGIGNRCKFWERIEADRLIPGESFTVYNNDLNVVSMNESEMEFTFTGKKFRLNKRWQVLGTPEA